MRTWDIVALAVLALRQRKLRTALTTLGVAVGCFVLVAGLSIGQGVKHVLLEQMRRQDQLRRIFVWQAGPPPEEPPPEVLDIKGEMSEARRGRLREAIIRRYQRRPLLTQTGISAANVTDLAGMEHVESVTPGLNWGGKALLNGKEHNGFIYTAGAGDLGLARRVIAGDFLHNGQREGVLVSEAMVYDWGIHDEADVEKLLGRTVRLEVAMPGPGLPGMLAMLSVSRPNLTEKELRVLRKVMTRLPEALAKLDLPDDEQEVLAKLLGEVRSATGRSIVQEQPIIGVFRDVERYEISPWDAPPMPIDVLVPGAVAEKMFFAVPGRTTLPQVIVRVDHEDNLRAVHDRITAKGYRAFSLAEVVEQVRVAVLLITIACGFVAVVALVVAGLGITNTMLMSVLQRTHEIGVMKAVGAREMHIQALFLMEGLLTGAAGALAGLVAVWVASFPGDRIAAWLLARQTPMRLEGTVFAFPVWLVVGVPLLVCLLATLAAVYPARRAAKIDPIAALRQT
jgi:putative ABC transport system permease protein